MGCLYQLQLGLSCTLRNVKGVKMEIAPFQTNMGDSSSYYTLPDCLCQNLKTHFLGRPLFPRIGGKADRIINKVSPYNIIS